MSTRTKKSHFVPRFYLDRFADSQRNVWQYDLDLQQVTGGEPEKMGLASNFYSPIDPDGNRIDDIEAMLSDFENLAAPLFDRLEEGENFIGRDREALAAFLAAQYLRSPVMISVAAELYAKTVNRIASVTISDDALFQENMDFLDKKSGKDTSKDDRERLRLSLLDPGKFEMSVLRHAGLRALNGIPELAEIFLNLTWLVVEPRDQHLITSDSPVVRRCDPKTIHPIYGDGGFMNNSMVVTFPISPRRALEMSWKKPVQLPKVFISDKEQGRFYNRERASCFDRFLFSSIPDHGILRLGQKAKLTGKKSYRTEVGSPSPDVKVVRKLSEN